MNALINDRESCEVRDLLRNNTGGGEHRSPLCSCLDQSLQCTDLEFAQAQEGRRLKIFRLSSRPLRTFRITYRDFKKPGMRSTRWNHDM